VIPTALAAARPGPWRVWAAGLLVSAACLGSAYAWHRYTFSALPDFSGWPAGEARKAQFVGFLRPLLEAENRRVLAERERLTTLAAELTQRPPGWLERRWLLKLADAYRVDVADRKPTALLDELLLRVDAVPASLGLAQAAKESGWGTSRFALAGNSLFGERCFRAGCGVVPEARRPGLRHEVRAFTTPRAAVASYIRNLNTHPDYQALRERRAALRAAGSPITGLALATELLSYSERGETYVDEVRTLIRSNDLGGPTAP
jgi:Bax protein